MGLIGRILAVVLSLPLLFLGSYGLLAAYMPDVSVMGALQGILRTGADFAVSAGAPLEPGFELELERWLVWPALRFSLAPAALVLLAAGLLPRSGGSAAVRSRDSEADASGKAGKNASGKSAKRGSKPKKAAVSAPSGVEKRMLKKAEKQARALAKKGEVLEAAELLFDMQHHEKACEYFIAAGELIRAAEIRHDQNRFVESAELYLEAGRHESAGSIFSQQGEYTRAAECFLELGSSSVAAEMYEKAGDLRRAAQCYRDAEFLRHAAASYVKCKAWLAAAECLEEVYRDESLRNKGDSVIQEDLAKLVRQAGKLYLRAEEPEKAMAIFERGNWFAEAGELALKLNQHAKAAQLFQDAGKPERAAEALRHLGEDEEAARILGNLHRDRGESEVAANCFEEAGDHLAAGDLYRSMESYAKAGACFEREGEFAQAAEMYALAGDRAKAASCYEQGRCFNEAAECYALLGQPEKEAQLLEQAGELLQAGLVFHRQAMDEEAIIVLQKLEPEQEGFAEASALLGDIFQSRGQLSLAIKKLRQAIGDREMDRDSLPVFYSLAAVYAGNQDFAEAVDVFEKILAFDYHYKDVERRLLEAREELKTATTTAATMTESVSIAEGAEAGQGRYQIVGELGRGGMGIVYRAKDTTLDRIVAFKVLPDSLKENPQALRNFLREAQSAAKLNHPNIVTVYDTGAQDGRYYIAMEYVDGTTLKEILRRRGAIAPTGILHVLVQMCEAMAYAHEKKVVHRDIKTANVMWTRDKKAKLMDFGLAKVIEEVRNHTTVISGTPYYMSPEQTLGKNVDHRTDIYSLGVTIFELATGTVPFKEGNIPYHHVHTPPPDIAELQPGLPPALTAVINRCLLKDPAQRYQSTREILEEIRSSLK